MNRITLLALLIIGSTCLKAQSERNLNLSQAPTRILSLDSTFLFIAHDKKDAKIDLFDAYGKPLDSWVAQTLGARNSPKIDDRGFYPPRWPFEIIPSDSNFYIIDLSSGNNIQVLHLTSGGKVDSVIVPGPRKNRKYHFYYAYPTKTGVSLLFTEQETGYHNRFKKEKIFWYTYFNEGNTIKLDSIEMPKVPRPSAFNYWRIAGHRNSEVVLYSTDFQLKSGKKPEKWSYQLVSIDQNLIIDSIGSINVQTPEKMRMNGKTNPRTGGVLNLSSDGSKILFSGIYGKNAEVFKNKVVKVSMFSIEGDSLWEKTIELPDEPWLGSFGYHNINQPLVYLHTQFIGDTVVLTVKDDHHWAVWKINSEGKILCGHYQFWEDLKPSVGSPTSSALNFIYNAENQNTANITEILNHPAEERIDIEVRGHLFFRSTHYFVLESEEKGWLIKAVEDQCPGSFSQDR